MRARDGAGKNRAKIDWWVKRKSQFPGYRVGGKGKVTPVAIVWKRSAVRVADAGTGTTK